MAYTPLILLGLSLLSYALISKIWVGNIISAPLYFLFVGVLLGPSGWNAIPLTMEHQPIHLLAEFTLMLILFTDASRIEIKHLWKHGSIPLRLLSLSLPLTILFGTAVAYFLMPLGIWECGVLATLLAPTDAALGQAIFKNKLVPEKIRQALNVESGLNDGLALPILWAIIGLASPGFAQMSAGEWVVYAMQQVAVGASVGFSVGYLGGKLVEKGGKLGWMTHTFQDLSALALAVIAYGAAEALGGNGFISTFLAGLAIGNCCRSICQCLYEFADAEGQLLSLMTFFIFGAVMVPSAWPQITTTMVVYALLSLTVIRMVPTALSLIGLGLKGKTIAFLGWFGPRGLATILFSILVIEQASCPHEQMLLDTATLTVLLSTLLHSLTAFPLWKL